MRLHEITQSQLDVPTPPSRELATLHKVKLSDIERQIKIGTAHEMEHTSDSRVAREIAMDHIKEDPRYYSKLKK